MKKIDYKKMLLINLYGNQPKKQEAPKEDPSFIVFKKIEEFLRRTK